MDKVHNPRVKPSGTIGFATNQTLFPIVASQQRGRCTAVGLSARRLGRLLRCTECGVRDADFVVTGERH
jgi:hypothetical protein